MDIRLRLPITRNVEFDRSDHPDRLIFRHVVRANEIDSDGFGIGYDATTTGNTGVDDIVLGSTASIVAVSDGSDARTRFRVRQTTWNVNGSRDAPTGGVCGRHHKVRDAIVAAVSAADTCADVTAAHRAGIASLDLSGEAIDSLRKEDFEGLAGLTELNLSGNALDYLPGNLFDHVATLTASS